MRFLRKSKEETELKEIRNHLLRQSAIKKLLKQFDKDKKEQQEIFDKSEFCPHISGGIGHRFSKGFADYYCVEGMPTQFWKNGLDYHFKYIDTDGKDVAGDTSPKIRELSGKRFDSKALSFKPCMYWDFTNNECKLRKHNES